jgi:phosphoribosylformylglycinamidine (FGAM) synthase-like amidotransferase family enzyme
MDDGILLRTLLNRNWYKKQEKEKFAEKPCSHGEGNFVFDNWMKLKFCKIFSDIFFNLGLKF